MSKRKTVTVLTKEGRDLFVRTAALNLVPIEGRTREQVGQDAERFARVIDMLLSRFAEKGE